MQVPAWVDREAFPFSVREVAGLSVVDAGQGPPIVFVHGTPTWSFEWRALIRAFSATHRCIAVDHLGFGLSPRPPDADYSPEAHARRFAALIEALNLPRFTLVAHDFGGPISLDFALSHPERLERVVLINTIAWPFVDEPSLARAARMAGGGLFRWLYRNLNLSFIIAKSAWGKGPRPAKVWNQYTSAFPDPDSRERVLWALAKSLGASTPFFQSLWERRERFAKTPIHFIWGLRDAAFPPVVLERFRKAWPHATVDTLPDAGHWPHEEAPEACIDFLKQALKRA
ncbi:alpha/beta fold hydrolase [Myxococcus fulvus]|uniref:alpha/beta fold hydrolase n=1 Tax=Myxococcus fulvus TaxID=33 RepID=UPI0020BF9175|nr:alpha/beta fold hydrolase [Myxococcus fulvus]MCK8496453.1 alpha/beta fold hydrolase [Myxococcus fulvus]